MHSYAFGALALILAISGPAAATPEAAFVPAPAFKAGDLWVFDKTTEKGRAGFATARLDLTVERVDGDTMLVGIKPDGAPTAYEDHMVGTDWSRRLVLNGQETVTNRPFVFPMSVGQTWTVDWTDPTRQGNVLSRHYRKTCTVTGWVDITVPAGTFHALKHICKGVAEAQVEIPAHAVAGTVAGSAGSTSIAQAQKGRRGTVVNATYNEDYYVPEIRNYVEAVDENYNRDNVLLTRITDKLVSFKPGA